MGTEVEILIQIRMAAQKKLLFLPHALRQMLRPDRMIRLVEVRRVISEGEVIEDYPKDTRGIVACFLGLETKSAQFMWFARRERIILRSSPLICPIPKNGQVISERG